MGAVASLSADSTRSRIEVGSWSQRVDALVSDDRGWRATLGIRQGFPLTIRWRNGGETAWVELWVDGPDQGAAVVLDGGMPSHIAAVAVCGCGEQGCSNASFQFTGAVPVDAMPSFVVTIRSLAPSKPTLADLGRCALWEGPELEA